MKQAIRWACDTFARSGTPSPAAARRRECASLMSRLCPYICLVCLPLCLSVWVSLSPPIPRFSFFRPSLHVRIVELVQDVVSVLLLPLYFAVSGLKTDLTLLDNAASWGICVLTICAACLGAGRDSTEWGGTGVCMYTSMCT